MGVLEDLWRAHIADRNAAFDKQADEQAASLGDLLDKVPTDAEQVLPVPTPPDTPDFDTPNPDPDGITPEKAPPVIVDGVVAPALQPISEHTTFEKYWKFTPEDVDDLNAQWKGKTVFAAYGEDFDPQAADADQKTRGLFTVTEIVVVGYGQGERLLARGKRPDGSTTGYYLTSKKGAYKGYAQTGFTELDIDPVMFKVTKKKNGSIVVGNKVVGTHNGVTITINPEYSVTGTQITKNIKKSQQSGVVSQLVRPDAVPAKAVKKTPETIALEAGFKKAPTPSGNDLALSDGTPAKVGAKVFATGGSPDLIGQELTLKSTYSTDEAIVEDSAGAVTYIKLRDLVALPGPAENWLVSSHATKDSNGDWIGPNYWVDSDIYGPVTVVNVFPKDGNVLIDDGDGNTTVTPASSLTKQPGMPDGVEILYTKDDFAAIAKDLTAPKKKKQKIGESSFRRPTARPSRRTRPRPIWRSRRAGRSRRTATRHRRA